MSNSKLQVYFIVAILLVTSVLTFFIFQPFLAALVLAVMCVIVFEPVHSRILAHFKEWPGLVAISTILVILVFVVTPLALLGTQIFQEAGQIYSYLSHEEGKSALTNIINTSLRDLQLGFPAIQGFSVDFDQYLKQGLEWLLANLGVIFSNLAKMLLSLFVFLIALYYLLKDGYKIRKFIVALSPLSNADDEVILKRLEISVNSIVRGSLLIGFIQGMLTMVGFTIFGVPNPVLWGSLAMIAALVPGIGTTLVIAPAVLFLFLTGETVSALGLLAWGAGAVGLIDNLLGPKLMGKGMHLHPLLVLLSVLGGLAFFGPIGIFLGPLTLSFLIALLDLHFSLAKQKSSP